MGHIAQMNMGYLLHTHGDPRIAGFEDNSDRVNAVADRSKGFIWRLQGEGYDLPENLLADPKTLTTNKFYEENYATVLYVLDG